MCFPFYDNYKNGLRFSCVRCSACCRYESGFVYLSEADAERLARALNLTRPEFETQYCRWVSSERGKVLSLKEKANFDCVFWDKGCIVYESRPLQCSAFPFWRTLVADRATWDAATAECPGMGKGALHDADTIEALLTERENNPFIERKHHE